MNALIQFIMKLLGLGDASSIEKMIKDVLLKKAGASLGGSGGAGGGNPLEDLMKQFKDKGLGNIFQSWVGTGQNQPITPDQVQQGLGDDQMTAMAQKVGISKDLLASKLAKYLPGVVDKMTPDGKVPDTW